MIDTSYLVNNALKVSLVLKGLKFQWDISKSTKVIPDFIRLKGKMTLPAVGTVVSYLEKDQEKLRDVTIIGLADAIRWVDKLLGVFTMYSQILIGFLTGFLWGLLYSAGRLEPHNSPSKGSLVIITRL